MTRITAILGAVAIAAAFTFAAPTSTPALAGAKLKVCKAKINGKPQTWRCQADQACCVNPMLGTKNCGIAGLGCL